MSNTGAVVYVVDDDVSAREGVARLIRSAGVMTRTFASGEEFLAAPRPKMPACLVLDVSLPGLSGLDVQQELVKSGPQLPIVFLTAHGDIPTTVRAVRAGAADFLTKPVDDEALLNSVRRCISSCSEGAAWLASEAPALVNSGRIQGSFEEIVGRSEALRRVLDQVKTVAPTDCTVLIDGETGTGKGLVARAIHNLSARKPGPFIKVNCAAIPATLLESELFGHEKGSFTGAVALKTGRFELANKGTLFLDEIGEIPLELQPKLLRAIQDQQFERVGGNRTIRTDARLVAATNRDLQAMVEENTFRADLYYRLHVFPLHVPPLRERREDIPMLARHFVQKHARRIGRNIDTIPTSVLDALANYDWPGNIRELQNVLERSVILTNGSTLQVAMHELVGKPAPVMWHGPSPGGPPNPERENILKALVEARGQVGGPDGAAARLGLKRTTLQSRMRRYNIERQFC